MDGQEERWAEVFVRLQRHYIGLALQRAGVEVDQDVRAELLDMGECFMSLMRALSEERSAAPAPDHGVEIQTFVDLIGRLTAYRIAISDAAPGSGRSDQMLDLALRLGETEHNMRGALALRVEAAIRRSARYCALECDPVTGDLSTIQKTVEAVIGSCGC